MLTAVRTSLILKALPPYKAYDYEYQRDRLADPAVLADAVALCIFRVPLLAIPVGGRRRGGCTTFDSQTHALDACTLLASRPGYPDLRIRRSPHADGGHVVEWGEDPPVGDDAARGRFYGYSEAAITARRREHPPQTPSSAWTGRSPTAS